MHYSDASSTSLSLLGRLNDAGDCDAWSEFVDRYGPKIYQWCRASGGQHADAEDVTQSVLARFAARGVTYNPARGSFRSWLKTVAKNAWRDSVKSHRKRSQGSGGSQTLQWFENVPEDGLGEALKDAFDREILDVAKVQVQQQVHPRDWQVFCCFVQEGLSGDEVAAKFTIAKATAYVYKSRVRKMLKEAISKLNDDEPES